MRYGPPEVLQLQDLAGVWPAGAPGTWLAIWSGLNQLPAWGVKGVVDTAAIAPPSFSLDWPVHHAQPRYLQSGYESRHRCGASIPRPGNINSKKTPVACLGGCLRGVWQRSREPLAMLEQLLGLRCLLVNRIRAQCEAMFDQAFNRVAGDNNDALVDSPAAAVPGNTRTGARLQKDINDGQVPCMGMFVKPAFRVKFGFSAPHHRGADMRRQELVQPGLGDAVVLHYKNPQSHWFPCARGA